jgi:hypothetical protein
VIVFDDSFEHRVWNLSNETRIVLLVNFWHVDLAGKELLDETFTRLGFGGNQQKEEQMGKRDEL